MNFLLTHLFSYNSENLKKANGLRATLLYNLFQKTNCDMVVTRIIAKALKNTASYTEFENCSRKRCKYSREECFPFLSVNTDVFKNDFKNLEEAISHNFPEVLDNESMEKAGITNIPETKCKLCKSSLCKNRTFGESLFIEVCLCVYLKNLNIYNPHATWLRSQSVPSHGSSAH